MSIIPENKNNLLDIGIRHFRLLHALDTALLAASATNLQHTVDTFYQYC